MTFDKFKADFLAFLDGSTVNLGRKTAKTRKAFITEVTAKFDAFVASTVEVPVEEEKPSANPMEGSVMCIKPNDPNKALDAGKGVHAMTPSESARADEQLNRSPFGAKSGPKVADNE